MTRDSNESAIRTLIDDWSDAVCKGDLERVVANRADDIVMFDVPEPAQVRGIDTYRDTWKLFFASNPAGPDRFRISELKIVADDQVAFAHGLLTIGGGVAHCRLTIGMRKIRDRWCVVHEQRGYGRRPTFASARYRFSNAANWICSCVAWHRASAALDRRT